MLLFETRLAVIFEWRGAAANQTEGSDYESYASEVVFHFGEGKGVTSQNVNYASPPSRRLRRDKASFYFLTTFPGGFVALSKRREEAELKALLSSFVCFYKKNSSEVVPVQAMWGATVITIDFEVGVRLMLAVA